MERQFALKDDIHEQFDRLLQERGLVD